MFNIFEQPWTLLAAAVISLLVILIIRVFLSQRHSWPLFAVPLLVAITGFGLDFFIKTDTEKIRSLITKTVNAVEAENADVIEPLIASDYSDSFHRTKAQLIFYAGVVLSKPLVEKIVKQILSLEISGAEATVVFTSRVVFDKRSEVRDFSKIMLFKVRCTLRKAIDNNWLISRGEILAVNNHPATWKDIKY